MTEPTGEFLLYVDPSGLARVQVRLEAGSVWMSQRQLAALFGTSIQNISQHLRSIYAECEVSASSTIKKYLIVQTEGERSVSRPTDHYSLPAIIALGYRVRSPVGTRFRQWATQILAEYAVKGFAMDDRRLKSADSDAYFEELLGRIRDIRSSERVFWRKVLDIYATSVDYEPSADASRRFFQTVQNKMHWAAHGHTAAEIIVARADADAPTMGLTSWAGSTIRKSDVAIAKNYLNADEIDALNRVVSAYLDFAELQAMNRRPMTMDGWVAKLDDFLRLADRDVLTHAGSVSADTAKERAEATFASWQAARRALPEPVDADFEAAIREVSVMEKQRPERKRR